MNGPGGPQLDWSAIFSRAHRRVAIRLAIAAAAGTAGAVLLFGSGTAARTAIHENGEGGPPPTETTTTSDPEEDELIFLSAEPSEPVEGEGEAGRGSFSVVNQLPTETEAFNVVATSQATGEALLVEVPALAPGDSAGGEFECAAGDSVVVEVESSEPHSDGVTVTCGEGEEGVEPEQPETTEVPATPEAPATPETPESPETSEAAPPAEEGPE